MLFPEYDNFDGLGLAALVRKREVSPLELVDAAIERIEAKNPSLNCVIHKTYERARSQARAIAGALPEGKLAGVPFLLKDLLALDQDQPTLNGTRFCEGLVPDHDSELVARHKRAGLIVLGKTSTPEMGILPITEPQIHGPARNPWDPMKTPGGSSGGAAAAVASGMVPWAHASDGGGSIRIPASCCGLFGLKPTRGRNPLGPDVGDGWHGLAVEHAVTRSVRDSAAILDATRGMDEGAPYDAPAPERPYLDECGRDPGRLRIALATRSLLGKEVHPECVRAAREAAELCRKLGHDVVENAPPIDRRGLTRAYLILVSCEVAAEIELLGRYLDKTPRAADFEPLTWMMAQVGACFRGDEMAAAAHLIHAASRQLAHWQKRYDLLLTPVLAQPPLGIGELRLKLHEQAALRLLRAVPSEAILRKVLDNLAEQGFEYAAFTAIANLAGVPAMSVPLHWSDAGLPIGVQFQARFGGEGLLFRFAAQLESQQPWMQRRPPAMVNGKRKD